jgi:hypothetical protein
VLCGSIWSSSRHACSPGCATTDEAVVTAENPAEHCRRLGLQEGSEGYAGCISNYIADYCTGQGLQAGTAAYAECEKILREASFLRQQLQMRGF